jgi:CRP/FNR family cyclic AMP-dependent transcriptional regulator
MAAPGPATPRKVLAADSAALSGERESAGVSRVLIRNVPLFSSLSERQIDVLAGVVQRKSFPRDTRILKAGVQTSSLYIIVSGAVEVVVSDRHGAEVILDILKPGEYFGEMGMIDDQPPSASVSARESCELLILSKKDFAVCLKDNFGLAFALQKGLVNRLRGANSKIGSLALLDVHGRVARVLLEMAETIDGRLVVKKLPKQDIAKLIGASREMVSRVLGNLQAQGHIEMVGSTIFLNPRALY